jgi:hypothetical protein
VGVAVAAERVGVGVGVEVAGSGVRVGVDVDVDVAVGVNVGVDVSVGVRVAVGLGVGAAANVYPDIGELLQVAPPCQVAGRLLEPCWAPLCDMEPETIVRKRMTPVPLLSRAIQYFDPPTTLAGGMATLFQPGVGDDSVACVNSWLALPLFASASYRPTARLAVVVPLST